MNVYLLYMRFPDTMGDGTILSAHWTESLADAAAETAARDTIKDGIWSQGRVIQVPKEGVPDKHNWAIVGGATQTHRELALFYVVAIEVQGSAVDRLAELVQLPEELVQPPEGTKLKLRTSKLKKCRNCDSPALPDDHLCDWCAGNEAWAL